MRKLFAVLALLCTAASCYADAAAPAPPPPPSPPPYPPPPGKMWSKSTFDARIAELTNELSQAKTNNDKAIILFQIGTTYAMQNKYADAKASYDKVLAMDKIKPTIKAATWMAYAEGYSKQGKYHKSRAADDKILSMTDVPISFRFFAQRQKIEAYLSDKLYVKTRTESKNLFTYKKSYPVANVVAAYYIGVSYLDENYFDMARKQFDKATKFTKNDISHTDLQSENRDLLEIYQQKALLGIAQSYFNQKQYSKAKEEYVKIVKMNRWGKFKDEAANEIKVIEKMQKKNH